MIKIKNLVTNKSKYKIFVDMDGTIADFDSAFINIADIPTKDGWQYKDLYGKEKFWGIIKKEGLKFWTEMPWTHDGKKLWNYLINTGEDVYVLSAPSTHDNGTSKKGKIIWCKENLGPNVQVLLEDDKYKFAGKNHILIDDLEKNIIPWRQHGGIGILHTSAEETISELNKIGVKS